MAETPPERAGTGETRLVTAAPAAAGQRLDRVLADRLGGLSRTRLKRLIEAGRVTLEARPVTDPSRKVKAGESFAVALPAPEADRPEPQALALAIVFEDAHLIVIDKPAGLVVHPAPGNPDHTLVNALLAHCGASLAGIGGVRRPGIVHRLDKDTSGLMVVAKTDAAHRALAADFAARRIERAYRALVWGVPGPRAGSIDAPIGRNPRDRKKMATVARGGKPALTRYRVLAVYAQGAASLLECRLATGRTHQIRVHLSARGHPLIGDRSYGRAGGERRQALPQAAAFARQALHANVIGFRHPATAETLHFESMLPSDFQQLVDSLEVL